MDPNPWNAYNIQYGSSTSGLPNAHPTLNRLDIPSGLSHTLQVQASHGSLGGRSMPALSGVGYPGLGVTLLDPMPPLSSALPPPSPHKSMAIGQGQILFDPQVRVSAEQMSPTMGRYDSSSKTPRPDPLSARDARSQLLGARMWGGTSFSPPSLYNQFSALTSEAPQSVTSNVISPSAGSSIFSSKSNQLSGHEPPPAHSSSISRIAALQRMPHLTDLYGRMPDITPACSIGQISSLYSPSLSKENTTQQQTLHRHTPVQVQTGYSSAQEDIEDLSSNSQSQLYSSYASLAPSDSHDFNATQLPGDMNYDAVSPAAPLNSEGAHTQVDNSSFSMVQFPDLANLTSEHAHTLADKFQENDFRLKMDSMRVQQASHDASLFSHSTSRHNLSVGSVQDAKDIANLNPSLQMNQRLMYQQNPASQELSPGHVQPTFNLIQTSAHLQSSQTPIFSTSSMQQLPAPPPIQALADSTTKPKRVRNRKKKDTATAANTPSNKKSSPSLQSHHLSQQSPNILNMPVSSHMSAVPRSPLVNHTSQQQHIYNTSGNSSFPQRDPHRTQTPSIPQNYTSQERPSHSYTPSPSPKISTIVTNQNVRSSGDFSTHQSMRSPGDFSTSQSMRSPGDFGLQNRVVNEKPNFSQSQRQRISTETPPEVNSPGQPLHRPNIPDSHMMMQGFPNQTALINKNGQGSPMADNVIGGMSRISTFQTDLPQQQPPPQHQQSIANHSTVQALSQPSPRSTIASDITTLSNKLTGSNQFMSSNVMVTSQPTSDSRSQSLPSRYSMTPPSIGNQSSGIGLPISQPFDPNRSAIVDPQESGQFQLDFGNQPFLEQLVEAQNPVSVQPAGPFSNTGQESGEVVFTTLVSPAETVRIQQHSGSGGNDFQPTYHGETVHEIRPIGPLPSTMGMEEMSFGTLFDNSQVATPQPSVQPAPPEPEKMNMTYVPPVTEDSDFSHFAEGDIEEVIVIKTEPNDPKEKSGSFQKDSFHNSFLSYLQGNTQETLTSLSTAAITKKPVLPKYIPEPRRPRPVAPPPPISQPKDVITLSDFDDGVTPAINRGKDQRVSVLGDGSIPPGGRGEGEGYSVQRTSELAVKITLPKNKGRSPFGNKDSALLTHNRSNRDLKVKAKKRKGKHQGSDDEGLGQGRDGADAKPARPEIPELPARASIGRKAKEKSMEKSKRSRDSGSSTEEEIFISPKIKKRPAYNSDDSEYDSDKDPVWMPFEVDLKQGHDLDEKKRRPRKQRPHLPSFRASKPAPAPVAKPVVPQPSTAAPSPSVTEKAATAGNMSPIATTFHCGQYIIEKKDLLNHESYPIWRLEQGSMIRKFELVVKDGVVNHQAVGTYSTWMKSMHSQFQPISVKELVTKSKGDATLVQVLEECRPKPPTDGKLVLQYEDDPLVETFNVYLQVFISQALEPNFLNAILERKETFYMDALNDIDTLVNAKVNQLAKQAQWKNTFKEVLHRCPLMKEINRPNLKQACQACENSSPPTIKSVVLSGHPYDRVLLTEKKGFINDLAQEFMIGKAAAHFVRTYHSLYHFKYWLRQRCDAKVKVMKESNKVEKLTDETILDKCLENRNWVLQLFDNLKNLLAFGGDVPR